jgi:hypothetical protein
MLVFSVVTASAQQSTGGPSDPPATGGSAGQQPTEPTPTSPLAIHVGDADLLIGGFMDATIITRTTNPGTGIGTSFGTIPFETISNVPQATGSLSETRFSAQNSRITLQATSKFHELNVKGYLEVDFLGNAPNGLNVTSNSNTLRMRLYWAQLTSTKFEFLAGQSWSLMTPNRNGISPVPADLYYSQDVDTNYQMGLIWERTLGFRFVGHLSDTVTIGAALENPAQYIGNGAVILPAGFPTSIVDQGTSTANTPNPYPDIIGKVAFDPKTGKGTHQHIDAAFLLRGYKSFSPATNTEFSATGTAGSVNAVLEPIKNIRFVATSFFSDGSGRYISNTNVPDFIVNADGSLSLVKSRSFIVGPEIQAGPKTLIYGYYSWGQFDQNVTLDTNGKQIGFGVTGNTAANHKLIEPTVGVTETFFRDPKFGGMQLMVQYSYLRRTPFSVPSGTPADAKLHMIYVNVRYILP